MMLRISRRQSERLWLTTSLVIWFLIAIVVLIIQSLGLSSLIIVAAATSVLYVSYGLIKKLHNSNQRSISFIGAQREFLYKGRRNNLVSGKPLTSGDLLPVSFNPDVTSGAMGRNPERIARESTPFPPSCEELELDFVKVGHEEEAEHKQRIAEISDLDQRLLSRVKLSFTSRLLLRAVHDQITRFEDYGKVLKALKFEIKTLEIEADHFGLISLLVRAEILETRIQVEGPGTQPPTTQWQCGGFNTVKHIRIICCNQQ